jgi:limonene-1,2-epoxide hydrolase
MSATGAASTFAATAQPAEVVRAFLLALEAGELDQALALLDEDVLYTNVSLPTIRGRARVERASRPLMERLGGRFRVHFHTLASEGQVVLTQRTDALRLGRVEQRFWVYGRFEVREGRITLWRDSFDWADLTVGLLRALAGALNAKLNRRWPGES